MKKFADRLLPVVMLLIVLVGLARTVLIPKDINHYENRPANRLEAPTVESVLSGDFQKQTEDALNDQIPLAQRLKEGYNLVSNSILYAGLQRVLTLADDRYVQFRNVALFDGYITYLPIPLEESREGLEAKAENYNTYMAAHPELDFYVYYLDKDNDIDFATGEKVGSYEYFRDRLDLDPSHITNMGTDSLELYQDWFYVTDHHWNYKGSYYGYRQITDMLGVEERLEPVETVTLLQPFSGSKAKVNGAEGLFTEDFTAYRFRWPEMDVYINGAPAEDYGAQEEFFDGRTGVSYGYFYGTDNGVTRLDTNRPELGSLLILADSSDNAILKLLAAGFDEVHSIDLRYYEQHMGEKFQLSQYAREHGIDTVLLMGSLSFFTMDQFRLEG